MPAIGITTQPGVSLGDRFVLSNGLAVRFKRLAYAKSVAINGYLRAGSNLDPAGLPGLAAFTAGVLGEKQKRTYSCADADLDAIGATITIDAGRQVIVFKARCLPDDLELVLEVLAKTLFDPLFTREDVQRQRATALSGLKRMKNVASSVADESFRRLLYGSDHPYGRTVRPTLETVECVRLEDVIGFHSQTYGPQSGMLGIVGNTCPVETRRMVEKIWGTWPARKAVRDKTIPFAPPLTANLHCHVEIPLCRQLTLVTGGYGPIRDSPDYLEARVADTVIGKLGIQGRIGRSLRKEGAAYECGSRLGAGAGPIAEPWCIYATISPEHLRMAVDIILNETRRLCEEHIEEEELANAKAHLIGSLQLKLGSCTGMASLLAAVEINQLPEDYAVCFGQHINAIDPEAVRAAAHSYLNRSGRVLATAGTEAEWH